MSRMESKQVGLVHRKHYLVPAGPTHIPMGTPLRGVDVNGDLFRGKHQAPA